MLVLSVYGLVSGRSDLVWPPSDITRWTAVFLCRSLSDWRRGFFRPCFSSV